MTTLSDFEATRIDGTPQALSEYAGKVVLVVNTASKCGLTPQYEGLEELHREFGEAGLAVLGFPCDQFARQEFDDNAEIAEFCTTNYDVTFPMFAKVEVNGPNAHPLYQHLKSASPGVLGTEGIKWNFTKFLVDRAGKVVARFEPATKPLDPKVTKAIDEVLSR